MLGNNILVNIYHEMILFPLRQIKTAIKINHTWKLFFNIFYQGFNDPWILHKLWINHPILKALESFLIVFTSNCISFHLRLLFHPTNQFITVIKIFIFLWVHYVFRDTFNTFYFFSIFQNWFVLIFYSYSYFLVTDVDWNYDSFIDMIIFVRNNISKNIFTHLTSHAVPNLLVILIKNFFYLFAIFKFCLGFKGT